MPRATAEAGNTGPRRVTSGRWQRRVLDPMVAFLKQGTSPHSLALSMAIGVGVGIFPVLGISTPLCAIIALVLRLNLAAIQLVNYAVWPLQALLIIPFVRVGEHLVGAPPQPLSTRAGYELLAAGVLRAVHVLAGAIAHAAIGWVAIGPILSYLLYRLLRPLLERAAARLQT